MKLIVAGSSPAYPNPGSASSGYLIEQDGQCVLVDCGHGVAGSAMSLRPIETLRGIVISHMHPDHYFDLVPLTYAFEAYELDPIPLWLPPEGQRTLEKLQSAVDLHPDFFANQLQISTYDPGASIEVGCIEIRFTPTQHFVPAYAMKFSYDGRDGASLFYSSDTGWKESVVDFAAAAGLALVEATLDVDAADEERRGHMTPRDAARMAREAGVQRLVLTHFPREDGEQFLRQARDVFGANVSLARVGDEYSV